MISRLFVAAGLMMAGQAVAQEKVTLKLALPVGKTYLMESNMVTNSTQTMMGQENTTNFTNLNTQQVIVEKQNGNLTELAVQTTKFKTKASFMGNEMETDSEKLDTTKRQDKAVARRLKNKYHITLNQMGKATGVMADAANPPIPKREQEEARTGGGMMRMRMGGGPEDSTAMMQVEQLFSYLPNQPVAIGQSWIKDDSLNLMGLAKVASQQQYTLLNVVNDIAIIKYESTFAGNTERSFGNGMQMNMKLGGTITGQLKVHIPTGMLKESMLTTKSNNTIEINGNETPQTGTTVARIIVKEQ